MATRLPGDAGPDRREAGEMDQHEGNGRRIDDVVMLVAGRGARARVRLVQCWMLPAPTGRWGAPSIRTSDRWTNMPEHIDDLLSGAAPTMRGAARAGFQVFKFGLAAVRAITSPTRRRACGSPNGSSRSFGPCAAGSCTMTGAPPLGCADGPARNGRQRAARRAQKKPAWAVLVLVHHRRNVPNKSGRNRTRAQI